MILVETINHLYEELFSINFSHSGLQLPPLSMLREHINVRPDERTKKILKAHDMHYNFSSDTFVCYARCRLLAPPSPTPKAAYIIPADNTRFRFFLDANANFIFKTNVEPVAKGIGYYFTNRANVANGMFISKNQTGVDNFDKAIIPEVDPKESYLAVIDIFSTGAINNSYELFTGVVGQLRSPQYRLNFISSI